MINPIYKGLGARVNVSIPAEPVCSDGVVVEIGVVCVRKMGSARVIMNCVEPDSPFPRTWNCFHTVLNIQREAPGIVVPPPPRSALERTEISGTTTSFSPAGPGMREQMKIAPDEGDDAFNYTAHSQYTVNGVTAPLTTAFLHRRWQASNGDRWKGDEASRCVVRRDETTQVLLGKW